MNDPTVARMDLGFTVCIIAVFVWASIDYNRFIKFWMLRPAPYRPLVVILFRIFFLAFVLGGSWQLITTAVELRKSAIFYLGALPFAVGWFAVFFLMINHLERRSRRWRTK
jgi:hypothetical protein